MIDFKSISTKYPQLATIITCFTVLMLLTSLISVFSIDKIIESFELKTLDWRFNQILLKNKTDNNIVLVVLDDQSLQRSETSELLNIKDVILPDANSAKVIQYLSDAGAKVIAFNSKFPDTHTASEGFNKFIESVKNARNVIFPIVFNNSKSHFATIFEKDTNIKNIRDPRIKNDIEKHFVEQIHKKNTEKLRQTLEKLSIEIINEDYFLTFSYRDSHEYLSFSPIPKAILDNCKSIGAINVSSSDDGILRDIIPIFRYDKHFYPSFGLAVARNYLPKDQTRLEFLNNGNIKFGNKILYLNNQGKIMFRWLAPAGTYKQYSYADVIQSYEQKAQQLTPTLSDNLFKNKIVLIGETLSGPNKVTLPISNAISGVETQANIIDNLINNYKTFQRLPTAGVFLITLLFSSFISILVLKLQSGFSVALYYLLIVFIYLHFSIFIFDTFHYWLDLIYPIGMMSLFFIVTFLIKYTILSKAYEDTYQLAIKDGLTGLYNHKYFQESLQKDIETAKKSETSLSLLMIDIDNFKMFNDTYGHRVGDAILRQVARTLVKSINSSDLVARYGGEEITVILYDCSYNNAQKVAQRLVRTIADTVFVSHEKVYKSITISIGVSNFPKHGSFPAKIIEIADKSLYFAKNNGKNQVGTIEMSDKLDETSNK